MTKMFSVTLLFYPGLRLAPSVCRTVAGDVDESVGVPGDFQLKSLLMRDIFSNPTCIYRPSIVRFQ